MKRFYSMILAAIFMAGTGLAQNSNGPQVELKNAAQHLIESEQKLTLGGYAQVDFNQPFGGESRENGMLDVHRMVMLLGYKFSDRVDFITEIEYEHVKEVYVEQAFLNYRIKPFLNFRAGLMLIPMGIINEFHEPSTFNGVERPNVDSKIVPTTWREIGFGFTGHVAPLHLKYQLYLLNGFNGYDGSPRLSGSNGLRKGRQKGAESFISSPNLAAKIDYNGIRGLNLGLAGYFGNTQSTAFDGIDKDDAAAEVTADSTVIGVSMLGLDARYGIKGFALRGQYVMGMLSNTDQYNVATGSDVGSKILGYYMELAYNVFHEVAQINKPLNVFVRYENYNTHNKVEAPLLANDKYDRTEITTGLGFEVAPGAVLKADVQFMKTAATDEYAKQFNAGVAIMF